MSKKTKIDREPHVLVGFGKHDLRDLMDDLGTPEGDQRLLYAIDRYHWPPRYRRFSICTEEDVATFEEYLDWIKEKLDNRRE